MKKVNTLIIGAGRSGTTSLCHYLSEHPDICFSDIKEVHFFSIKDLFSRGDEYFHSYFSKYNNQKIIASADTYLLIDKKAPKKIFEYNPSMKLIVLLREPVERSYSSYHYAVNNGYQENNKSFLNCMNHEKEYLSTKDIILKNNLCHFYGSLYYTHLRSWTEYFSKENFLILTTKELESAPEKVLQKINSFLNISPFKEKIEKVHINKAAPVKFKKLQQFLLNRNHPWRNILRPFIKPLKFLVVKTGVIDFVHRLNKQEKTYNPLSTEEKKIAQDYFKEDLENLKNEFNISFDR